MSTVYDLLKQHKVYNEERKTGEIGLEIETETLSRYEVPGMKGWRATRDNSLRNFGIEYVLNGPMSLAELDIALEEFKTATRGIKFIENSISTSVHVHLNMMNEPYIAVANLLTTYAIVENPLIRYSGPDRLSNLFCLPMKDAEFIVDELQGMLKSVGRNYYSKSVLQVDRVKYAAINCAPLTKWGSVEFRSFRGTTDIPQIKKWVGLLYNMKQFSKQKGLTPVMIMEMYKNLPLEEFFQNVFGSLYKEVLYPDAKELIEGKECRNLLYGAKLATSVKSWVDFGVPKIKKVYREKVKDQVNAVSQSMFSADFDGLDFAHRIMVQETYHRQNTGVRIIDSPIDA